MKKAIPALLCAALITASCESEVKFRGGGPAPKMIVNSIAAAGEGEFYLKTDQSVFIFGDKKPQPIKDASLLLSLNGEEVPLAYSYTNGGTLFYKFRTDLAAGDRLEFWGEAPGHPKVHGTDVVPEKAEIKDLKKEWFTGGDGGESYLRTLITIKDTPGERNYYRIVAWDASILEYEDGRSSRLKWKQKDVYVDQEPLFSNTGFFLDEDSHPYRIFSDELFDGGDYTLNVYFAARKGPGAHHIYWDEDGTPHYGYREKRYIRIEIQTLSENYYKYLNSRELAWFQDDFAEPVKIYSNIQGGYGILATYNLVDRVIETTEE